MIAREIVDKMMRKAEEAQVIIRQNNFFNISTRRDKIDSIKCSQSMNITIKALVGGKLGISENY